MYGFSLKVNREVTDAEMEALFEAGCDDAAVETGPLGTTIEFDREAPSLAVAITTAVRDVEKVPGLLVVGLACANMVTLLDIAQRAGVTREAARLWATGQRGGGDFPPAVIMTTGGERLWDWEQVAPWLLQHGTARQPVNCDVSWTDAVDLRILHAADCVLRARDALRREPDDHVRKELERLLADA
jgi:hypothetical protein